MNQIKTVLSSENIHKICKVCLEEKPSTISLLATIQLSELPTVPIKFCDILSKLVPDVLPEKYDPNLICTECIEQLSSVYLFLIKYEESVRILKQFVEFSKTVEDTNNDNHCLYDNNKEIQTNNVDTDRKEQVDQPCRKRYENTNNNRLSSNQEKLHVCPICTKEFTALELREHAHTHKALKKYLSISNEYKVTKTTRFYTTSDLNSENSTIFTKKNPLHKCPFCHIEYRADQFRLHVEQHRKHDEFQCEQCQRVFSRLSHLNIHRLKHMKEYPYKCEYCNKGFVIKKNYDCHLLTHTETELPYKCEYCFKRFANPIHVHRHQLRHTQNVTYSIKYKVCRCYHCRRSFRDKTELDNHHCVPLPRQTAKSYTCKTCKKEFSSYSTLYNHRKTIHHNGSTRTLCSVCGKKVTNIYTHMMFHNGIKPYKCDQCEKSFSGKPQLKQHLLVHSGIKPFVCSCCGKAFNNLYNLQVHERIHKGDKNHLCPICGKGFLEKSYLRKHLNTHRKI